MVSEWWRLGFVLRNPFLPPGDIKPDVQLNSNYISVERTPYDEKKEQEGK